MTDTRRNLYVSIVILAAMVGFLVWSYQYDPRNRLVPVVVAWAGVILCVLDLVAHIEHPAGRLVRSVLSGTAHEEDEHGTARRFGREAIASLWMIAALAGVILFGFLPTTPVYVFSYMLLQGRRSVRQSAVTAVVTTLFIWIVFELLLRYELFRGILFEE